MKIILNIFQIFNSSEVILSSLFLLKITHTETYRKMKHFLLTLDILISCPLLLEYLLINQLSIMQLFIKSKKNLIQVLDWLQYLSIVNCTCLIMVKMLLFRCLLERTCVDKYKLSFSERFEIILSKIN